MTIEPIKLFMVMPFSNEACNSIYTHSIIPICKDFNIEVRRADEIYGTSPIYDDIYKEIHDASIIIVDISDKNPNVFYELGIAHTLKQERTIIITQDDFSSTPFDIKHFRIIDYQNTIEGKSTFERKLKSTLSNLLNDGVQTFKNEFEFAFSILESSKKNGLLISLIGLKNYQGQIFINSTITAEGRYSNNENSQWGTASDIFLPFYKLGYVRLDNDLINITEKGKSFVKYLIEKGYECNMMNDEKFTPNYIPILIRRANKKTQQDH